MVIRNMINIGPTRKILIYLGLFMAVEIFSYLALVFSGINIFVFLILVMACLLLSFYKLEFGFLMVLGELFTGSMGHLFVLPIGGFQLPIRMALWFTVLFVFSLQFVWQLIKHKTQSEYYIRLKNFAYGKYFIIFGVFVVIGLVNALLRGNSGSLIIYDFNAWLYWFLLFPAIIVYSTEKDDAFINLKTLFLASALWLSLKTLFLLFIFTHNLSFASEVYRWLRQTLSGEMTATLSGWPRIFIQGQIFSGVALCLVLFNSLKNFKNITNFILAIFFSSALLISFSRSFWVALVLAVIFSLIVIFYVYSWRKMLASLGWLILSFVGGFALIYLVVVFPYPNPGKFNADFLNRVSSGNEAALASRWSLLPVLMKEIGREPFFGQGYGATITYVSSDPRILEKNPSGTYTTYAFEWGYFDIWLKIGLFGLLSYLLIIFQLIKKSFIYGRKLTNAFLLGLSASLVFLAVTNFFTPYLNHPLGIGILLLGACLIRKDRVY